MNAKLTGVIVGAMLAGLGLGLVTPPRVQANGTGKVLLGIAAGALLYGLIDSARDDDRRCDRNRGYVYSYGGGCYTDRDDWRWRHRDRDRCCGCLESSGHQNSFRCYSLP